MVSTILDQDDIGRIRKAYWIPDKIRLEVPSLSGKVIPAKGDRVALYEEALKTGLKLRTIKWSSRSM